MKNNIDSLFETDENGKFIRLVIPFDFIKECHLDNKFNSDLNLVGRERLSLNIDEIVLVKKYAQKLYETIGENNK